MNGCSSIKVLHEGIDFGQGTIPVGRRALRDCHINFSYETAFIG